MIVDRYKVARMIARAKLDQDNLVECIALLASACRWQAEAEAKNGESAKIAHGAVAEDILEIMDRIAESKLRS